MKSQKTSRQFYEQKIDQLVEILKTLDPEKIILFGSAARGRLQDDSDIDLCIIKRGDRLKIKQKIWGVLRKEGYNWEIEPDIHVYNPKTYLDWLNRKDPFIEEIEKGRVCYEG